MKNKHSIIVAVCIAAVTALSVVTASAAGKTSASPSPKASASASASASATAAETKAPRPIPFHGVISAVDQAAKTFTIAGKTKSRVFKVGDKAEITKGGSPATMSDIAENSEVSGSYWKNADGSLEAKTVKIGPAAKAKASTSPATSASASASASPKKP
jgi:Cu/Ag efflux protein CusF